MELPHIKAIYFAVNSPDNYTQQKVMTRRPLCKCLAARLGINSWKLVQNTLERDSGKQDEEEEEEEEEKEEEKEEEEEGTIEPIWLISSELLEPLQTQRD